MGRKTPHGVILKVVSTNICGSDQHMVRGRTTAPEGLILGHEITGEVVEVGRDVEFIKKGDLCSVPFHIACGRCRSCKEGDTGVCLTVNPDRPGSAYGYVDMGGWVGGQAEYVMVPYADWNLLKFPDKEQAMEKILDLTMLSDIFPTGFHGAYTAGVGPGSTVYIAGAGIALCVTHRNYDLALEIADFSVARLPRSDRLHLQRGIVLAMKENFEGAKIEFEGAVKLAPHASLPYVALGLMLLQMDRPAEAVTILRQRTRKSRDYLALWSWVKRSIVRVWWRDRAQEREAVDALSGSITLKPDVPQSRISRRATYAGAAVRSGRETSHARVGTRFGQCRCHLSVGSGLPAQGRDGSCQGVVR